MQKVKAEQAGSASRSVAALTDRGRIRAVNEDSVFAQQLAGGSFLLAVADGVAGLQGGDLASKEAISALADELVWADVPDVEAALEQGFQLANKRVRDLGRRHGSVMASTLVAALVRDDYAWLTNVGDSRAYLFEDGRVEQLTRDHSLIADQILAGVLTAEEGETSDYQNVITRGIGVEETVEPDTIGPVHLPAESVLLLCSDGLYRTVDEAQMAAVLSSGTANVMAEQLIELANEAGGPDNIAVVIFAPGNCFRLTTHRGALANPIEH
jgi:PPM family protein phosphatase